MPICVGPFTGICDANIAAWMSQRLATDGSSPDFLYWVTLNSHLPVPVPPPLKDGASCTFSASLAESSSLCSWYQLVANVHHSAADLALGKENRPTVFVIVGDHAPPFSETGLRGGFSPDSVPYILLTPRSSGTR